jgi:hypothetical protein
VKKPTGLFEWNGLGKDITSIRINVDEQRAYLYNGEEQLGWTYVATGITSFPTPIGEFKVLEKISDKVSNLYGKGYDANGKLVNSDFKQGRDLLPPGGRFEAAKMTYFMRLTGDGVGMHIGPIPRPGKRASHGCIRLPSKFAGTMFKHTAIGTSLLWVGGNQAVLRRSTLRIGNVNCCHSVGSRVGSARYQARAHLPVAQVSGCFKDHARGRIISGSGRNHHAE